METDKFVTMSTPIRLVSLYEIFFLLGKGYDFSLPGFKEGKMVFLWPPSCWTNMHRTCEYSCVYCSYVYKYLFLLPVITLRASHHNSSTAVKVPTTCTPIQSL